MALHEPIGSSRDEFVVKGSRFVCQASGVREESEARELLRVRREEHPKANHLVYAFSWGDEKNRQFGMSDDGEPKNTAGRPTLEVLKGSGVTNVLVTTLRYFGGTKLGTGGLVSAYTKGAQLVLDKLPTRELVEELSSTITLDYAHLELVKREIEALGARVISENFGERINLELGYRRERRESLERRLRDLTRGEVGL